MIGTGEYLFFFVSYTIQHIHPLSIIYSFPSLRLLFYSSALQLSVNWGFNVNHLPKFAIVTVFYWLYCNAYIALCLHKAEEATRCVPVTYRYWRQDFVEQKWINFYCYNCNSNQQLCKNLWSEWMRYFIHKIVFTSLMSSPLEPI